MFDTVADAEPGIPLTPNPPFLRRRVTEKDPRA